MPGDDHGSKPDAADQDRPAPRRRARRRGCLLVVGVLLGVLVGAVLFGFRPLVHHLAVEQARQRGVLLKLGEVHLGWSEVRLEHFRFALAGLSAVRGEVEVLVIELDGWTPTQLEARGVDLDVEGSAATLAVALSEWTKAHPDLARIPARAEQVELSWRPQRGAEPWLHISNAAIDPTPNGGRFVARRALVLGVDVGQVGASWTGTLTQIDLGFGAQDLDKAPISIAVAYAGPEPQATIALRPTALDELASPLGVRLPIEGVTASGTVELSFVAGPMTGPIHGTLQATFDGYSPPVPQEIRAFVFGKTTELETEISVSDDRQRVTLSNVAVQHGAFELAGAGSISRQREHAEIALELKGSLRCADVAEAAARARLGQAVGGLVAGAAKIAVKGSVAVRLEIHASTRDLTQATVQRHIGVGCGLRGLGELPLPKLPDLPLPDLRDLLP